VCEFYKWRCSLEPALKAVCVPPHVQISFLQALGGQKYRVHFRITGKGTDGITRCNYSIVVTSSIALA
jgi:hypothetical protein